MAAFEKPLCTSRVGAALCKPAAVAWRAPALLGRRPAIGRQQSVCVRALFGRKPATPKGDGKPCRACKSKGSVTCPGCKGTGRNKQNGNVFERWKCYDCQGFGLISCKACGGKGLTPEQRGER